LAVSWTIVKRVLPIGAVVFVVVACSSPAPHEPPLPPTYGSNPIGGNAGGGDGGAGSGNGPAISGTCGSDTYDADRDSGFMGTTSITGKVTFSAAVPAGHTILMQLYPHNAGGGLDGYGQYIFSFTTDVTTFTYRYTNITDGEWSIEATADIAGGPDTTDPGDLDGYYPGTASSPIHDEKASAKLMLPPCYEHVDFGAGPK
jgi:hypothetical protein